MHNSKIVDTNILKKQHLKFYQDLIDVGAVWVQNIIAGVDILEEFISGLYNSFCTQSE